MAFGKSGNAGLASASQEGGNADFSLRKESFAGVRTWLAVPPSLNAETRVLVSIHGISRNAREHAELFGSLAARHNWVIIAPRFTRSHFPGYQRLGLDEEPEVPRSDLALNRVLAEVERALGISTQRFGLFGFSGGAQFAHRYALVHPQRVRRLAVAAAGFYTFPDHRVAYPRGLSTCRVHEDLRWGLEGALSIPTLVLVGERDTERAPALRTGVRIDRQQGADRRQRARRWAQAWRREVAARGLDTAVLMHELPGCGHDFRQTVLKGGLNIEVMAFMTHPRPSDPLGYATSVDSGLVRFML